MVFSQPIRSSIGSGGGADPRTTGFVPNPKAKVREQVHEAMRFFHYSRRTEEAYWGWIYRYLKFHRKKSDNGGWRHPREMGAQEVAEFLSYLARERDVAAATQNQALNALVFLYGVVLRQPLGDLGEWARVTRPARLPAVLSRAEVNRVLAHLRRDTRLVALLLYGAGLRLMECLTLRLKDLDLSRGELRVRRGKGGKDRVTMLPVVARESLEEPDTDGENASGPGTAYLVGRLKRLQRQRELAARIHEPLTSIARSSTSWSGAPERPLWKAAYLVPRDQIEPFMERVRILDDELSEATVVCTGPWPPYSFSSGDGAP